MRHIPYSSIDGTSPKYRELRDEYRSWIPLFLEEEKLEARKATLKAERKEILRALPSKKEFLKKLEQDYSDHQQRRAKWIKDALSRARSSRANAFSNLRDDIYREVPDFMKIKITLDEIRAAVAEMDGGMPEEKRNKAIEKIDREMAEIAVALTECRPESRFIMNSAYASCDTWAELVTRWRSKQSRCKEKIGPQGFRISTCTPDEAWAYKQLGVARAVSKGGMPAAER